MNQTKTCLKCKGVFDVTGFNKCKQQKDGVSPYCKRCSQEIRKKSYLKHKEKRDAEVKAWNERNKKRVRELQRNWYKANPEKSADKRRRMYDKHKEKRQEYARKWRKKNKAHNAELSRRYDANKRNATPRWADFSQIKGYYIEAERRTRDEGQQYHVDHVIPLCGKTVCGLHVQDNLQVILAKDNLRKATKLNKQTDRREAVF